jgi:hypothetical protein
MRTRQSGFGLIGIIVLLVTIGLVGALAYVGYSNFVVKSKKDTTTNYYGYDPNGRKFPPLVAGAPYIPDGLTDQEGAHYLAKYAQVPGLNAALDKIAKTNPCAVTEGRFKQIVLGVTEDQTQALIGNGCGSKGYVRSFMIKQNGEWIRLGSWDGYFNDDHVEYNEASINILTDTPSCELVNQYAIQKAIAPVCYTLQKGQSKLYAGDSGNYTYVVR